LARSLNFDRSPGVFVCSLSPEVLERRRAQLQWRHNGMPPDLHLELVRDTPEWFGFVAAMLFGELNRHDPHLFDALRTH
jgi:hypothetical protein